MGRLFTAEITKASFLSRVLLASIWSVNGEHILTFTQTGTTEIEE